MSPMRLPLTPQWVVVPSASQSVIPNQTNTETHPNPSQIHTHTLTHVGKPDAERVRKSRKSLAEKTLVMAVPSGVASAGRKDPVMR